MERENLAITKQFYQTTIAHLPSLEPEIDWNIKKAKK